MQKIDNSSEEYLYQHHWLFCGEVFTQGRGETMTYGTKFNVLICTDTQVITKDEIDRAQKLMMQRLLLERPPRKNHRIVDCYMANICYLGLMNKIQFNGNIAANVDDLAPETPQVH